MVLVILFDISYAAIKIMSSQLKLELRRRSRYMVCLASPKMIVFCEIFYIIHDAEGGAIQTHCVGLNIDSTLGGEGSGGGGGVKILSRTFRAFCLFVFQIYIKKKFVIRC